MSNKKPIFSSAMDGLRRLYGDRLRERELQLKLLLKEAEQAELPPAKRAELHNHAHSLAGSGATYGYPDISRSARILEEAIDNGALKAAYTPLVENLIATCKSISSTQTPPMNMQGIKVLKKKKSQAEENAKKSIVIVDDDAAVHDFIRELFKNDIRILSAYNGKEGLDIVHTHHPNLILLDGSMDGMTGMDLLSALQKDEETKDIPIIMLTAYNKSSYVALAIESGAVSYIVKPFDAKILTERIYKFITPTEPASAS